MSIRHLYYYGLIETQKELYKQEKPYYKLIEKVASENNILLSIKLMSENGGRNTPGLDEIRFKNLLKEKPTKLIKTIRNKIFFKEPKYSKRVYIPKGNGKLRPLGIQSIYDRITQQCFLNILEPIVEKKLIERCVGFRSGLDGIQKGQNLLMRNFITGTRKYVLDVDLKGYFDTIDTNKVLDSLRHHFKIKDTYFLKRIKSIMVNKWVENGEKKYSNIGVPQGSILGPIFGNILLHGLDLEIDKMSLNNSETKDRKRYIGMHKWGEFRKKYRMNKVSISYVRFADDIRVIAYTKSEITQVYKKIKKYCDIHGIILSKEKTKIEYCRHVNFTGLQIRHDRHGQLRSVSDQKKIWLKAKASIHEYRRTNNYGKMLSNILGLMLFMKTTTNIKWFINRIEHQLVIIAKRIKDKRASCSMKIMTAKKYGKRIHVFQTVGRNRTVEVNFWDLWNSYKKDLKSLSFGKYSDRFEPNNTKWINVTDYISERINSPYNIYVPGLLHLQKFKCRISKKMLTPYNFQVHHKIAIKDGGTNEFSNLMLVHRHIHKLIHNGEIKLSTQGRIIKSKSVNIDEIKLE